MTEKPGELVSLGIGALFGSAMLYYLQIKQSEIQKNKKMESLQQRRNDYDKKKQVEQLISERNSKKKRRVHLYFNEFDEMIEKESSESENEEMDD